MIDDELEVRLDLFVFIRDPPVPEIGIHATWLPSVLKNPVYPIGWAIPRVPRQTA